ncbi:hypothetical protein F5B19DRAFT_196288 [Rostrohypoxylon terebratum]|nr:hypothetical protein F5B19DRAFT_196288 [Rostrohypoxylon terebratum]
MRHYSNIFATAMLLIALLLNGAIATHHGNVSLLEDAALFDQPSEVYNPGIGPRYFINGMPPIPALWPPAKAKRQTPRQCMSGYHGCLEVGSAGATQCCQNDQYCFLDDAWEVKCCAIGSKCNSTCPETQLYCNQTLTSSSTINTQGTTTIAQETSVISGCCGRSCNTSAFLCQAGFGGQCCPYGANCISGGQCSFPPTTAVPTLVTPAPSGCTTSQITCEVGGGCCNIGSTCTSSVLPTTTLQQCAVNLTVVDTGGLSEGARVGVGVGVAVGAAVVIGAVTWFWITRRRKAKSARQGDGFSRSDDQMDNFGEPFIPRAGTYPDSLSPSSGLGGRPMLHETGLAYAYNGPDAVRGPYTESTAAATELRSSPGISDRGATVAHRIPENPGDIYRSVELDAQGEAPRAEPTEEAAIYEKETAPDGKPPIEHHSELFELVGSPVPSPPPMSQEETERQRAQALTPSLQEANEQEGKEAKK